jgi:hypothetical protein
MTTVFKACMSCLPLDTMRGCFDFFCEDVPEDSGLRQRVKQAQLSVGLGVALAAIGVVGRLLFASTTAKLICYRVVVGALAWTALAVASLWGARSAARKHPIRRETQEEFDRRMEAQSAAYRSYCDRGYGRRVDDVD